MRIFNKLLLTIALAFCLLLQPVTAEAAEISTTASACLVGDADTGQIIYSQNAYKRVAPASTLKILTGLLVVEAVERGELSYDTQVTIAGEDIYGMPSDISTVSPQLMVGEQLTVGQLLVATLMMSDCNACSALARTVSGSVDNFVALMNARAKELGCTDSYFVNPSGYPSVLQYTTAYSLFIIAREAMQHQMFADIVATTNATMPATNMCGARTLTTTNALMYQGDTYYNPYVVGIKTGNSASSGKCLVAEAKKDGHTVISVVLGESRHYNSDGSYIAGQYAVSNQLLELGLSSY